MDYAINIKRCFLATWNKGARALGYFYLIMCLWACDKLVATQLLKDGSLKANHSKTSVSLLSLMNPMLYLLSTTCTYACFTFIYFEKILDGYQFARVRRSWLVINQSVVPVDLEFSPKERSVFLLSTI